MFKRFAALLTLRKILLLQALAALLMLGGALVAQYGFSLYPCELCLKQRYPYAAIAAIGGLGFLFVKAPKWRLALAITGAVLFSLDASIAFYHTGVELDIFKGPDACSSNNAGETLEEIRAAILNAPLVSCKQAMASFLGLSMAAWNGLAASVFACLSILGVAHVRNTSR